MKNLRRVLTFIIVIHASFSNAADPAEVIFTDSFEQCDFTFEAPEGSIEWDAGGDGTSWSDALNWKGDTLPVNGDDVFIRLKGGSTVTYDISPDATSLGSLYSCELLTVTVGTLELTEESWIRAQLTVSGGTIASTENLHVLGRFEQSGGTVDGGGTITVSGDFIWTDGRQVGSGLTIAKSGMTASGISTNRFLRGRTLTLDGDSTLSGGLIRLWDAATINNNQPLTISNNADMPFYSGANSTAVPISVISAPTSSTPAPSKSTAGNCGWADPMTPPPAAVTSWWLRVRSWVLTVPTT